MPKPAFANFHDSLLRKNPGLPPPQEELDTIAVDQNEFERWLQKNHEHSNYGRASRRDKLFAAPPSLDEIDTLAEEIQLVEESKALRHALDLHIWSGAIGVLNRSLTKTIRPAYSRAISYMEDYLAELYATEKKLNTVYASIAIFISKVEGRKNVLTACAAIAAKEPSINFEQWIYSPVRLYAGIIDASQPVVAENVIPFEGGTAA